MFSSISFIVTQFPFHSQNQCSVLPQISAFTFGDDELNLDETVAATCIITKGDLPVDVWWTLRDEYQDDERNLTSNDGVMITRNTQKISVLNIEAVKARHRGNYTCFAKNKAGIIQHSAYLAINGSDSHNDMTCLTIIIYSEFCNLFLLTAFRAFLHFKLLSLRLFWFN